MPIYTGQSITVTNTNTTTWRFSMGICKTPHSGTNTQDTNWQTGTSKSLTALSDGILYVQLRRNDTANITPSDIPADTFMLERGVVPTTFAAYFTPIELCKIETYRDKIRQDLDTGKWYLHKETGKVVFDGSVDENWANYATATEQANYIVVSDCYVADSTNTMFKGFSNYFVPAQQGAIYSNERQGVSFMVNQAGILIKNSQTTTVEQFKTWLSSHPTSVYYPLATPTNTEITDSTLLGQLNYIATLYGGQNNIELVPTNDLQASIAIQYSTFEQYNKHNVYIWNDDIDDWQVIIQ